jgi:hypothetical protein
LLDLAKKYKDMQKYPSSANANTHRSQMLLELQSLASALIKTEKKSLKQKAEWKEKQQKMKEII